MKLFLFTNSTGCMCYEGITFLSGYSYVDRLQEYNPEGMWINGITALHVYKMLPRILKGSDRIAILHFGACEAFSHPPANFINLWLNHWFQQVVDPVLFQTFILPKILKASECLLNNDKQYFRSLLPAEFEYILDGILKMLQGTKTLVIGMSQPNDGDHPHWVVQAWGYNEIMRKLCEKHNAGFLNIWDSLKDNVQDSNHLDRYGHQVLLGCIQSLIGENHA